MRVKRLSLMRTVAVLALMAGFGCAGQARPPVMEPDPASAREESSRPPAERAPPEPDLPEPTSEAERDVADVASVEGGRQQAEARVGALDEETEAEFLALFGPDPLGLARVPENARRYEIPLELNEKVEAWIDYFQNVIPGRFALYLARLGRYENLIRTRLRAAGMPEDLIYLALIESGMNPNAYSRARAVGMWQFIQSTGHLYGLDVDYWVDERRDPIESTEAAIRHLSDLYEEFGSWYLAAAAYNAGAGRVRRALRRTGSTDFWELAEGRTLRAETRNYVPKLIAAAIIAKHPERYGFGEVRPDPPLEFEEVEVPDATSFDVLARAAGTDEATIRELNPHFRRYVTPPDRRVKVRVPAGAGARFAANYAKIPPSERVTWLEHVITRGETLSGIARRYGTSVSALQAANGNIHPRRLRIGQRLIVPRAGRSLGQVATATPAHRSAGPTTVVVRRGDTLWSIARRYNVSTRDLIAWNHLASTVIHPGDRLRIQR